MFAPVRIQPLATPSAIGAETTASIAAAVIADTGALAVGSYRVEITLGFSGTVVAGKHIVVQHRDAANTGNIGILALCPSGASVHIVLERVVIAATERIRAVIGAVAAGVGEVSQASIRVYLLS